MKRLLGITLALLVSASALDAKIKVVAKSVFGEEETNKVFVFEDDNASLSFVKGETILVADIKPQEDNLVVVFRTLRKKEEADPVLIAHSAFSTTWNRPAEYSSVGDEGQPLVLVISALPYTQEDEVRDAELAQQEAQKEAQKAEDAQATQEKAAE